MQEGLNLKVFSPNSGNKMECLEVSTELEVIQMYRHCSSEGQAGEWCGLTSTVLTTLRKKTKIQSAVVLCVGRLLTEKMHITQNEDSNPQSSSHFAKKDQFPYLSVDQLSRQNLTILKQEKA